MSASAEPAAAPVAAHDRQPVLGDARVVVRHQAASSRPARPPRARRTSRRQRRLVSEPVLERDAGGSVGGEVRIPLARERVGLLEQLRPLGNRDDLDPAGSSAGCSSPSTFTCSTCRSTSRKPKRSANALEPSSSTSALASGTPKRSACAASSRRTAVPTPRRLKSGSTRGATPNRPARSERSARPLPASSPSSSASSRSRSSELSRAMLLDRAGRFVWDHDAADPDPGLEVGVGRCRPDDDHPDRFSFPCFLA